MKTRYGFHPKEFNIGGTEKYYSDMSKKGWELIKRGAILSRFQKTEPKAMNYRVEVVAPKFQQDGRPTDEQLKRYEEAGWQYVDGSGYIHIFRALPGCPLPEYDQDPKHYAVTLKCLRKNYIIAAFMPLLELLVLFALSSVFWNIGNGHWGAQIYLTWVSDTWLLIGFLCFFFSVVWDDIWGMWHLSHLYHRIKNQTLMEYVPKRRRILPRLIRILPLTAAVICFGCVAWGSHTYPMPKTSEDLYLTFADLGIEGIRIPNSVNSTQESEVSVKKSLLADSWHCQEFIENGNREEWMYQDIYSIHDLIKMEKFVNALMLDTTFARSAEAFSPVTIAGLDQAWAAENLECIAVKGNTVAVLTGVWDSKEDMMHRLETLSEKWNSQ